jgi:GxxExxY protein
MDIDKAAGIIVDAGFQIHRKLGPGLTEHIYHTVLSHDLPRRGLFAESKPPISFEYEGLRFENAFIPDIVVERLIVIEVKAVPQILPIHYMQLRTYLRLMNAPLGFLMNFGEALFKNGIKRVTNYEFEAEPG